MSREIVVIGTSWGGLHAVGEILAGLPGDFAIPIVVVQHRAEDGDDLLADLLDRRTALAVCEAEDKAPLRPGRALVAPRGYHLLVERGHVELSTEHPVRFSRPSIDLALCTAADAYGEAAVGVVLTGANADGAEGLTEIRRHGGLTVVQDPETAERADMPAAALAAAEPHEVRALDGIAHLLVSLTETVTQ
jgi:two-component system, chemotaxis family, protein-glutamate methylesterase/glutaminase